MSDKKEVQSAEEFAESGGEEKNEKNLGDTLLNNPTYMPPALRRQCLQHMVKSLPESSQNCVKALKNLQIEQLKLEVKFYEEVYELQKKYQALYDPLYDKRKSIVTGDHVPTEAEAEWKSENEEEISPDLKNKFTFNYGDNVKGIPSFWLTVFRNTVLLSEMIQEHDEEALKKLMDVKLVYKDDDPMSYIFEFHFAKNEYFTNSVLTKQYFLRTTLNPDEPFTFEGPEIYKCIGCDISWNKGMNLTVKTIKKKQKHKARNAVRTVTKQVPTESFFHFFNPPIVPEDITKVDVESQSILTNDFEIGHIIRESIIPKAVLYYTGDIIDDEDDDDLDEEDDDDEEEEEEEEDEDDDHEERGGGGENTNRSDKRIRKTKQAAPANPAECQTQ